MSHSYIQAQFEELIELLSHPRITNCENRRGLRQQTGSLLEDAFLALAIETAPDLSVEIGAHEASFSARLKRSCPQVQAIAFEANPHVFEKYLHAPDNSLETVQYKNAAICSSTGFVDLYIPTKWSKGSFNKSNAISSLLPRTNKQFEYEKVSVPALTLDDALANIDFCNAVAWIDVEGAQREIIKSGTKFFSHASAIYIEVETVVIWKGQIIADEVSNLLAPHGFVPIIRDNLANIQFNQVYININKTPTSVSAPIVDKYIRDIRVLLS
jgi:FkbM family methyltransferase